MGSISVIVATLDRPALLLEAVASALDQRRPALEILVVDDGSIPPVDDAALADSFGPMLRVLHHPKQEGLAWARNHGVEAACGDYVVHLDDDDRFAPELLEACGALLDADPHLEGAFIGVEGFGRAAEHFNRVHPQGVAKVIEQGCGTKSGDHVYTFGPDLARGLLSQVPMPFQRIMARRTFWQKVHRLRLESYRRACGLATEQEAWNLIRGTLRDSEWALYAAFASTKLALVDLPLYRQRCDGQGRSSKGSMRFTHVEQGTGIKTVMLEAAATQSELRPFRDRIRTHLARGRFDAAFQLMNDGLYGKALEHLVASFRLQPQARHLKLLAQLGVASAIGRARARAID